MNQSVEYSRYDLEQRQVREFFVGRAGFFVDIGANDPQFGSQTYHLEQSGWTGVLIEPQPDMAEKLRANRSAQVFAVACSSPRNAGRHLPLYLRGGGSCLDLDNLSPDGTIAKSIDVPARVLDDILVEADAPAPLDFLSIDIEGHEIEALSGFDFSRWRPRLILIEDHVSDLTKHRFMRSAHYRLVRYTPNNNAWYVPDDDRTDFGWRERWGLLRKFYLALPIRKARNLSRSLRQAFKDWCQHRRKRSPNEAATDT